MQWGVRHTWGKLLNLLQLCSELWTFLAAWPYCVKIAFQSQVTVFGILSQLLVLSELFVPVHSWQLKGQTILLGWSSIDSLWLLAHVANRLLQLRGRSDWRNPKCSSRCSWVFSTDASEEIVWGFWTPLDIHGESVFSSGCLKTANCKHKKTFDHIGVNFLLSGKYCIILKELWQTTHI